MRWVLGILAVACLASFAWTMQNFTVPGSAQHSNAWAAALKNCPGAEGEAVADAERNGSPVPTPGARDRCAAEGGRRLTVFVFLVVALGTAAGLSAATSSARALRRPLAEKLVPS